MLPIFMHKLKAAESTLVATAEYALIFVRSHAWAMVHTEEVGQFFPMTTSG
jgi:hypothetical protein